MVKADSKQKNVRLRLDAWFALEELQERWGCSRDTALERAIVEAHSDGERVVSSAIGRGLEDIQEIQKRFNDPVNTPGVSQGKFIAPSSSGGFLECRHCGRPERIHPKAGAWRACSDCAGRHSNFPDCRQCVQDAHAKELAAKSSACETDNIEFTEDWGA